MRIDGKKSDQATVTLTAGELTLLNNALNEVCNGIAMDDDEFLTRLGIDRKTARKLLADLGRLTTDVAK
jgi:Holliday junction resolvasome RuvABC DNA-binding subunit